MSLCGRGIIVAHRAETTGVSVKRPLQILWRRQGNRGWSPKIWEAVPRRLRRRFPPCTLRRTSWDSLGWRSAARKRSAETDEMIGLSSHRLAENQPDCILCACSAQILRAQKNPLLECQTKILYMVVAVIVIDVNGSQSALIPRRPRQKAELSRQLTSSGW